MFNPVGVIAAAPKSAPFINDVGTDMNAFAESMKATNDTTKSALLAIIRAVADAAGGNDQLALNCEPMFGPGEAAAFIALMDTPAADVNNPTPIEAICILATAQVPISIKWISDLVNASKKKEIDGDNVEGYFASLGRSDIKGTSIASFINKAANFLPDMISEDLFRENLTESLWTDYHSSRVSSGKLLSGIKAEFIELGIIVAGDEVDVAITESEEAPWDVQLSYEIPRRVVGYAAIFFEVSGKDVGTWKQGEKALDDVPAVRIKAVKSIFKKYLEVKNNIGNIDAATTVNELTTAIPAGFF